MPSWTSMNLQLAVNSDTKYSQISIRDIFYFNSFYIKLLISQSLFSGTIKFSLSYRGSTVIWKLYHYNQLINHTSPTHDCKALCQIYNDSISKIFQKMHTLVCSSYWLAECLLGCSWQMRTKYCKLYMFWTDCICLQAGLSMLSSHIRGSDIKQ